MCFKFASSRRLWLFRIALQIRPFASPTLADRAFHAGDTLLSGFRHCQIWVGRYVMATRFQSSLRPYLANLTASFAANANDGFRDQTYPDKLEQVCESELFVLSRRRLRVAVGNTE